jgi:cytochrome c1
MRKYLIAAVLVTAFAGPALAEQFYVAFDPASHKCTMMHSQPAAPMKSMGGPYATEDEAHKAMAGMKDCEG